MYNQLKTSDHRPIAVSAELSDAANMLIATKKDNGKGWTPLDIEGGSKYRTETWGVYQHFDTLQQSVLKASLNVEYSTCSSRKTCNEEELNYGVQQTEIGTYTCDIRLSSQEVLGVPS